MKRFLHTIITSTKRLIKGSEHNRFIKAGLHTGLQIGLVPTGRTNRFIHKTNIVNTTCFTGNMAKIT